MQSKAEKAGKQRERAVGVHQFKMQQLLDKHGLGNNHGAKIGDIWNKELIYFK